MATHVASDPLAGGDTRPSNQEPTGTSYAHAVLNFKNNDSNSNKENIHDSQKDTQIRSVPKNALQENKSTPKEPIDSAVDDGESFTPVVSHSRKERKGEKNKREKLRENNHKQFVNGNGEKREVPKDHQERDKDEEKTAKPKVFVEAPLPKVNPWQVNKNAAKVLATTEKRVLQPPKQETSVINGQASPAVVTAPKDRRRFNQKVSWYFKNRPLLIFVLQLIIRRKQGL